MRKACLWICWGAIAFLVTILFSCQFENEELKATKTDLLVSAAASLQEPLVAIKPLYLQSHPQVEVTYNFAGSGSLRHQIEQGAPVDIFISAAAKHMDILQANRQLIDVSRRDLLANQIVLIQPKGRAEVSGFQDLKKSAIAQIAIGEPESVPAGEYAREILDALGLFQTVESKLVYGKDVRQVLNYVATGNVDAGIVYRTDVRVANNVEIVAIAPASLHSPVVYPIAVVRSSANPTIAQEFVQFLSASPAREIFQRYGFAIAS